MELVKMGIRSICILNKNHFFAKSIRFIASFRAFYINGAFAGDSAWSVELLS